MLYGPLDRSRRRNGAWPLLHQLIAGFRQWLQFKEEILRLRRLDDHLLADLGIPRDQIAARVKGRRGRGAPRVP